MKEVIIAEKPSMGRDIAKALGCNQNKNGYIENGKGLYVTWAFGHLMELKDPESINKDWGGYWSTDKLPMIPTFDLKKDYKVRKDAKDQFNVISGLLKDADAIYNAGDPDREGELLIDELLANVSLKKEVKKYRLWLLDLNSKSIQDEFAKKRKQENYVNLFHSAWTRQKADWLVGMNLTQLYTLKGKGESDEKGVWSVGRVQTAIVDILVQREKKILDFKPETYYTLNSLYKIEGFSGLWFEENKNNTKEDSEEGEEKGITTKIIGKDKLKKIYDSVKDEKQGKVEKIESGIKKIYNKGLYSKTELVAYISQKTKIDVNKGSSIIDDLYEKFKILSYPRTDSNYINDEDFAKVERVINELEQIDDFKDYISYLRKNNLIKPNNGFVDSKKVTAHTGLYPVIPDSGFVSTYNKLAPDYQEVLKLVILKLLSNLYPPYEYLSGLIIVNINGHKFRSNGNILKQEGWKILYKDYEKKEKKDIVLPELKENDFIDIDKFKVEEKETQPPKRYNFSDLLKYMENLISIVKDNEEDKDLINRIKKIGGDGERKLGLGTPATRENIIETIIKRGYVEKKGKSIFPTDKGMKLIDIVDNEFINPITTAIWEDKLRAIADGELGYKEFEEMIIKNVREIIEKEKGTIKSSSSKPKNTGTEIEEKCPKCGTNLVVKKLKSKKTGKDFEIKECPNYKISKKGAKWLKDGCDFSEFMTNTKDGNSSDKKPKNTGKELDENCPVCNTKLVLKKITSKKNGQEYEIKECPNYKLEKDGGKWNKKGCNYSEFQQTGKDI